MCAAKTSSEQYPKEFLDKLHSVTNKRPKTVIDLLLKYGSITTEDLETKYGYTHGPRAIRDVRELGIPIEREMVSVNGKRMARYRLGDPKDVKRQGKNAGRTAFSKKIKNELIDQYGPVDFIYLEQENPDALQIDHRIPYEIGGDGDEAEGLNRYMLLTSSANRLKSHACENCPNWHLKNVDTCRNCFWAHPERYRHVACKPERAILLDITNQEAITKWDLITETRGEAGARKWLTEIVEDVFEQHSK